MPLSYDADKASSLRRSILDGPTIFKESLTSRSAAGESAWKQLHLQAGTLRCTAEVRLEAHGIAAGGRHVAAERVQAVDGEAQHVPQPPQPDSFDAAK